MNNEILNDSVLDLWTEEVGTDLAAGSCCIGTAGTATSSMSSTGCHCP